MTSQLDKIIELNRMQARDRAELSFEQVAEQHDAALAGLQAERRRLAAENFQLQAALDSQSRTIAQMAMRITELERIIRES